MDNPYDLIDFKSLIKSSQELAEAGDLKAAYEILRPAIEETIRNPYGLAALAVSREAFTLLERMGKYEQTVDVLEVMYNRFHVIPKDVLNMARVSIKIPDKTRAAGVLKVCRMAVPHSEEKDQPRILALEALLSPNPVS